MTRNTKPARKTAPKPRTKAARVPLTNEAYAQIEAAAFKNCRTVSQELTYRIEAGLRSPAAVGAGPYFPPAPPPPMGADVPAGPFMETTPQVIVTNGVPPEVRLWTPEEEAHIEAAAKTAGVGEGQLAALRLIHKTPEAVLAAVQAEAREPAGAPA